MTDEKASDRPANHDDETDDPVPFEPGQTITPPETEGLDEEASPLPERVELAEARVAVAENYGSDGKFEQEDERLEELADLAATTTDAAVREAYARALANATNHETRTDVYELPRHCRRLERKRRQLADFYEHYPDRPIARQLARAEASLVAARAKIAEFEEAARRREAVANLYETHGHDGTIAEHLGRALANEAQGHVRNRDEGGDPSVLEASRERVGDLYERDGTDAMAASLASLYADTVVLAGNRGDRDRQAEWLARLSDLYDDHGTDDVAESLAWARSAVAVDCDPTDLGAITTEVEHLRDLYETHPTDGVARGLIRALDHAVRAHIEESDHVATEMVEGIRGYYERHPYEPEAQEALARTLRKLAAARASAGELTVAEGTVEELESLSEDHPTSDTVAGNYANACLVVGRAHVEARNLDRARDHLERDAVREWYDGEQYEDVLSLLDRVERLERARDGGTVAVESSPLTVAFVLAFAGGFVPAYLGLFQGPFAVLVAVAATLQDVSVFGWLLPSVGVNWRVVRLFVIVVVGLGLAAAVGYLVPTDGVRLSRGRATLVVQPRVDYDVAVVFAVLGGYVGLLLASPDALTLLAATTLSLPVLAAALVAFARVVPDTAVGDRLFDRH